MDISIKFVTDNRKARLKKSKRNKRNKKNQVLQSSQGQDFSTALCTNTSSPENSSAYKCNSLSLESTQDREFLDILEELQKHEPCISDIRTTSTRDERL